jgi:hypothetical protein
VIFSDLGEAVELFRHPQFFLPFAGPARVVGVAILAAGAFVALLFLEPPAWRWSPGAAILIPGLMIVIGFVVHGPLLDRAAAILRRLEPSGDPFRDASKFGPCAIQLVYSLIARQERPERRLDANRRPPFGHARRPSVGAPVVILQCESFFDPRRLGPGVPVDLVPRFAESCRTGEQWGRLSVPGWGANTTRAEFAVMTGLSEEAIGLDRFNPYFAFARAPLASLARRMRSEGYRTICLHPFDRTYYRRDHVIPYLGFDVFLGEEAFAGAERSGHYVSNVEVARVALDILREEGPATFLFAITMDNHGPWDPVREASGALGGLWPPPLPVTKEHGTLLQYLSGVQRSDVMLGKICDSLSSAGAGVCALYGDHLPGLPKTFAACDFTEISTDYVIWRPAPGPALRRDLAAHDLAEAIFSACCDTP